VEHHEKTPCQPRRGTTQQPAIAGPSRLTAAVSQSSGRSVPVHSYFSAFSAPRDFFSIPRTIALRIPARRPLNPTSTYQCFSKTTSEVVQRSLTASTSLVSAVAVSGGSKQATLVALSLECFECFFELPKHCASRISFGAYFRPTCFGFHCTVSTPWGAPTPRLRFLLTCSRADCQTPGPDAHPLVPGKARASRIYSNLTSCDEKGTASG
jgi:hypothetical protein